MKALILVLIWYITAVRAQHPDHHVSDEPQEIEPAERGFPKNYRKALPRPEVVTGIKKYAQDDPGRPQRNFGVVPIHDNRLFGFFFIDRLEQHLKRGADTTLWDATGRIGNNFHRLFLETEGKYAPDEGRFKESRNEFLYGYALAPFWDLQGGYRRDFKADKDDRNFAVLSLQGMSPFAFEVDAASYLSEKGDVSGLLELEYTLLLGQRTQLIPRLELEGSLTEANEYDIGRGLNGFEIGLRLSHQIFREFAPYFGLSWERKTFGTQRMKAARGEETSEGVFLLGARIII